jgi:two-component system sensor histidine kinase QseC
VDASIVIDAVASDLARLATEKDVSILVEDNSDGAAHLDAGLLTAALRNVVENAIIASPPGGTVILRATMDAHRFLIAVLDQGPGISEIDRPRITDRFYRGKGAKEGGSGLGLSIVATAMERLGGRVNFQLRPDGGEIVSLDFDQA